MGTIMSTNNNVFANKITAVHDELYQVHNLLSALIVNLNRCLSEEDDVNLTKEIGSYVLQLPEYLNDSPLITVLRKVCTRELSVKNAFKEVNTYIDMINEALDCFDESALYQLSNNKEEKIICTDEDSEHKCECGCEGECKCKCGGNCECDSGGCECEKNSEEDDEPELVSDEDLHLEISIRGSKEALSALLL